MNETDPVIYQRPNYYQGLMLGKDHFLREQKFHTDARRRHNLQLHGWGVVRGLEVTRKTADSVNISPGYAIEESGLEVFLISNKEIDLANQGPNDHVSVYLKHADAGDMKGGDASQQQLIDVYAQVSVSRAGEETGVFLATVQLDDQGKIGENAIDTKHTRYVRILEPGSIRSADLNKSLKKGWLKLPFRPVPLVDWQTAEKGRPPFRIGATEALSIDPEKADEKDRGAAGTMAIPVPPGVTKVTGLRIAGARNEGEIRLNLYTGGWDWKNHKHIKKKLLEETFTSSGHFEETFSIEANDAKLDDPDYQTLSLRLEGTRRTAISLIAVEFVYWED